VKISAKSVTTALTIITTLSYQSVFASEDEAHNLAAASIASSATSSASIWDDHKANTLPSFLSSKDKKKFDAIFTSIEKERWEEAKQAIKKAPKGPLRYMAQAELYLAAGSPRVEREDLLSLLNNAPYLPQADQLSRLATTRGAETLPNLPGRQKLSYKGSSPSRNLPRPVREDGAEKIRTSIIRYIKNDAPSNAEDVLNNISDDISDGFRTEMQQRIAWSYYIENDNVNALRLSNIASKSAGEWAVQARWVEGLSNWRLGNYSNALTAFDHVAKFAHNADLRSAGYYWASRAAVASKHPELSQSRLQLSAHYQETFYGLLAREALGMTVKTVTKTQLDKAAWKKLRSKENVQIALSLSELDRRSLAKETIQFQARIADSNIHNELGALASKIGLPETQLWLAQYSPSNTNTSMSLRYPTPNWAPTKGWRIDSALAFAHTLQESAWRKNVVSPANAHGLMQVRPGTARDIARASNQSFKTSDLHKPSVNLEYGQSFLEHLRDSRATEGLLPKVIAAYNAGLTPVTRWNQEIKDGGDPLLYIESIPYWETRGYVATILRNYWIYEQKDKKDGGSKTGLAQNLWPSFPKPTNGDKVTYVSKSKRTSFANR